MQEQAGAADNVPGLSDRRSGASTTPETTFAEPPTRSGESTARTHQEKLAQQHTSDDVTRARHTTPPDHHRATVHDAPVPVAHAGLAPVAPPQPHSTSSGQTEPPFPFEAHPHPGAFPMAAGPIAAGATAGFAPGAAAHEGNHGVGESQPQSMDEPHEVPRPVPADSPEAPLAGATARGQESGIEWLGHAVGDVTHLIGDVVHDAVDLLPGVGDGDHDDNTGR
jgi:hypothetical protein